MSILISFFVGVAKGCGLLVPPLAVAYYKKRKKRRENHPHGKVKGGSHKKRMN